MGERAQSIIGDRLLDLFARALPGGYLEVFALADVGAFAVLRSGIGQRVARPSSRRYQSMLEDSFRRRVVQEAWTDGDSLLIVLEASRGIVYECTLPDALGVAETIHLLEGAALTEALSYFREQQAADAGRS